MRGQNPSKFNSFCKFSSVHIMIPWYAQGCRFLRIPGFQCWDFFCIWVFWLVFDTFWKVFGRFWTVLVAWVLGIPENSAILSLVTRHTTTLVPGDLLKSHISSGSWIPGQCFTHGVTVPSSCLESECVCTTYYVLEWELEEENLVVINPNNFGG